MVLAGLVKRRARLAGDIEAAHQALRGMILDLENVDATIQQFDPSYKVESIKPKAFRPPKDWANRGEMSRIVLSILRQAAEPLTSRDIALQLLVERALDKNDLRLLRLMTKRVGVSLRGQARHRRGSVRTRAGAVHGLADRALMRAQTSQRSTRPFGRAVVYDRSGLALHRSLRPCASKVHEANFFHFGFGLLRRKNGVFG